MRSRKKWGDNGAMDKCEADRILKFCIRTIKGEAVLAPYGIVLSFLISCKQKLEENCYFTHARILEIWIHRFEQNKGFLRDKKALQPPKAVDRELASSRGGRNYE